MCCLIILGYFLNTIRNSTIAVVNKRKLIEIFVKFVSETRHCKFSKSYPLVLDSMCNEEESGFKIYGIKEHSKTICILHINFFFKDKIVQFNNRDILLDVTLQHCYVFLI